MTATRLLAVPTSALQVDPVAAPQSTHGYTERELQEIAATVPAIYQRLGEGWRPADFDAAAASGDGRMRQLGRTYRALFTDSSSARPLRASFDGNGLVVDDGNHRVQAARQIGVPVVPVWVSAPDEATLERVDEACAHQIDREGASAYRGAHVQHEQVRGDERTIVQERGRPPAGREREWSGPDMWRRR